MKIKNKFLMGALLTVSSLGVVGSITGTYAWFSYNTKSPLTYHGILTGDTENLQVKVQGKADSTWSSTMSKDTFIAGSTGGSPAHAGTNLKPVSFTSDQACNGELQDFSGMLSRGNTDYEEADDTDYLQETIQFRCVDQTGTKLAITRDLYISDITVVCYDDEGVLDDSLANAIRIHFDFDGGKSLNVAPGISGTGTGELSLFGKLDLDGDGSNDNAIYDESGSYVRPAYEFDTDSTGAEDIVYGVDGVTEGYYQRGAVLTSFENGIHVGEGFKVGTIPANGILECTITIYLQGWAEGVKNDTRGAEFDLGMTFQVDVLD